MPAMMSPRGQSRPAGASPGSSSAPASPRGGWSSPRGGNGNAGRAGLRQPSATLNMLPLPDPDLLNPVNYQDGFQAWSMTALDKNVNLSNTIRDAVRGKSDLVQLRGMYSKLVLFKDKVSVDTRLVRSLQKKIDSVFARLVREAVDKKDAASFWTLAKQVDEDPILAALNKSTNLRQLKAQFPEPFPAPAPQYSPPPRTVPSASASAFGREKRVQVSPPSSPRRMDRTESSEGLGSPARARSATALTRGRTNRDLSRTESGGGTPHTAFNAETGRCTFLTELAFRAPRSTTGGSASEVFAAAASVGGVPRFAYPSTAEAVLGEVLKLYQIFEVPMEVVQTYPRDSSGEEKVTALGQAQRMQEKLVMLGVPAGSISASAKAESPARGAVGQYCDLQLQYEHVCFDMASGKITCLTPLYQKRVYAFDRKDDPGAQFRHPEQALELVTEIYQIWRSYDYPLQVVCQQRASVEIYDDEHEAWLNALMRNRVVKIQKELVAMGVPLDKVTTKVEVVETDEPTLHVNLVRGRLQQQERPTAQREISIFEVVNVDGCGVDEFNGRYRPVGFLNDRPKFRHEDGGPETITWAAGFWHLSHEHSLDAHHYRVLGNESLPPKSGWKLGKLGELPAPIVTVLQREPGARGSRGSASTKVR